MLKFFKKYKLLVLTIFLGIFNSRISHSATTNGKCEQVITVKYNPYAGVKVYTVSGSSGSKNTVGKDKRGIIDLGHFSGLETEKNLNLGTIEVTVQMVENGKGEANYEVEIVDINKLQNYMWNYEYEVTQFINGASGAAEAKIKVDNYRLSRISGGSTQNTNSNVNFSCTGNGHDHQRDLSYRFDLILELKKLGNGGMYGFSPKKPDGNKAYINIKDIVVDQLKKSTTAPGNK